MKELKIVQLLRTFSKEETKLFRKFAESPYFNEGRNMLPLIDELMKYYPDFNQSDFSKDKLFKVIYKGEKYDGSAADKQLSRTAGMAKKFLLQRALEKQTFIKNIIHTREYNERKLNVFFTEQLSITESDLSKGSQFEIDFFYNKLLVESVRSDYYFQNKDINTYVDYLLARSNYAILDFMLKYIYSKLDINIFRYELNLDLKNSLAEKAGGLIDLEGLIKLVKESGSQYSYVLEFKYYELSAMQNLNIESFSLYKQVVYQHLDKLTWSEKYNTLGTMNSICIMAAKTGNDNFRSEELEVCRKMLDENSYAYNENSFANISRYSNILLAFIQNNKNNFVDELIDKFGKRLDPEHRESMINYSYMNKYFIEKKYKQALTYHVKIDYNHTLLKLNVRILLLKIYYELGYMEESESLIDTSLKYYSSLTSVSPRNLERAINLSKYVRRLIKLKEAETTDKIKMLYTEVESIEDINSRSWLLEKIKEVISLIIQ